MLRTTSTLPSNWLNDKHRSPMRSSSDQLSDFRTSSTTSQPHLTTNHQTRSEPFLTSKTRHQRNSVEIPHFSELLPPPPPSNLNQRRAKQPQPLAPINETSLNANLKPKPLKEEPIDCSWLDLQFHDPLDQKSIKKPHELQSEMTSPPSKSIRPDHFDRIAGSIVGMAIGDALGAHVEFRPHEYLVQYPVFDLGSGGTWGLAEGQFTDDTSMALCLAASLISRGRLDLYDQLVRYKWWHKHGYMSSTGACFDIGNATKLSIDEFGRRQKAFAQKHEIPLDEMDRLDDPNQLADFDVKCSEEGVAGNGALMRLAPVPLFFFREPLRAVESSGQSGVITHGDVRAYDACRYYGALIVAAMHGYKKEQLLDQQFYQRHRSWFGKEELHSDILQIAEGSYQKDGGYGDGIRGGGYIVKALEAALWAFWSTTSFKEGALAAVNLGDDTDTTAAIYGQLAGCFYGLKQLPEDWLGKVYARDFLLNISRWILYVGERSTNGEKSFESQPMKTFNMSTEQVEFGSKGVLPPIGPAAKGPMSRAKRNPLVKHDAFDEEFPHDEFALHIGENRRRSDMNISKWMQPLCRSFTIEQIHQEDLYQSFLEQIKMRVDHGKQRIDSSDRLRQLVKPVPHHSSPFLIIVRGWIACDDERRWKILHDGFTELDQANIMRSTKEGLCLKSSPAYAAEEIDSDGYLIMCYIILHDTFPIALPQTNNGERYRFYNGGKPSFRPKSSKKDRLEQPTRLATGVKDGLYDQFIVFDPQDILVGAVVHIGPKATHNNQLGLVRSPQNRLRRRN